MIVEVDDLHLAPCGDGGEFDAWRALSTRKRRELTGAGFAGVRGGYAPDQLAHTLNDRYGLDLSVCDAVELWAREALRLIEHRRRVARSRRERRLAERHGCTWYEYRAKVYKEATGAESVHHHARLVGWR